MRFFGRTALLVGSQNDTLICHSERSRGIPASFCHSERSRGISALFVIPSAVEESPRTAMLAECRNEVLEVLKRTVRPEFLNRIDEVIMFEPLSQTDIREILRMQIRDLQHKLGENGVTVRFTEGFEDYMSTKGYEPQYGARPIKRLMQKELINLLAKSILDGHVRRDSEILVDVQDGQIIVK